MSYDVKGTFYFCSNVFNHSYTFCRKVCRALKGGEVCPTFGIMPIIILNSSEYKLGILADEICESMNVNFDEIIENRLQSADETLTMEFVQDGEIYQVVDIEQLFKNERLAIV